MKARLHRQLHSCGLVVLFLFLAIVEVVEEAHVHGEVQDLDTIVEWPLHA